MEKETELDNLTLVTQLRRLPTSLLGHAERALELMQTRASSRVAFGKKLADQGTVQQDIALSRIEIEQVNDLTFIFVLLGSTLTKTASK